MEKQNMFLEAAVVEEVLQLILTVTDTAMKIENMYFGQIRAVEEFQKLKENFETLSEVLEWMKEPSNVQIDLEEMLVIIKGKVGPKNIITFAKIKVKKETGEDQPNELEVLIDRCSCKDQLSNDEMKHYFEILADEILQMKSQQRNKGIASFKQQQVFEFNKMNEQIKNNFEKKLQVEFTEFKKQLQKLMKEQNEKARQTNWNEMKEIRNEMSRTSKIRDEQNEGTSLNVTKLEQKYRNGVNELQRRIDEIRKDFQIHQRKQSQRSDRNSHMIENVENSFNSKVNQLRDRFQKMGQLLNGNQKELETFKKQNADFQKVFNGQFQKINLLLNQKEKEINVVKQSNSKLSQGFQEHQSSLNNLYQLTGYKKPKEKVECKQQ